MLLGIINTVFTSVFLLKAELCWPSWGIPRKTRGGDWPLLPLAGVSSPWKGERLHHANSAFFSLTEELKEKLTEYVDKVNGQKPGFIKVVRHSKQEGLIRSRVSGWRAATAPVVALFDAHVEFNVGW